MNTDLEQNKCDHIAYCLENQYHALRTNVFAYSEFLAGPHLKIKKLKKTLKNYLRNQLLFIVLQMQVNLFLVFLLGTKKMAIKGWY